MQIITPGQKYYVKPSQLNKTSRTNIEFSNKAELKKPFNSEIEATETELLKVLVNRAVHLDKEFNTTETNCFRAVLESALRISKGKILV